MADRTIEIVVDVRDATGGKVKGLQNQLKALDQTAQRLANRFKSFSTLQYAATIRLIDRVTEPGNRINSLLRRLAGTAWRISLNVADGALGKIRQVETLLMRIAGKAWTIGINVRDNVKGKLGGLLSGAAMGAGVMAPMAGMMGVGFGVANAIQAYAGFEQQMSKVQAITQLKKDSDEMKMLVQQAKDLGAQTAWTRQQVGEAQYYQALAGWAPAQIQAATPHMLNLASAGGMDLGAASDMLTDAMTAFGLKATDTYKNAAGQMINLPEYMADMFAKVQAVSNTNLYELKEATKFSASTIGTMFGNVEGQEGVQLRTEAARQMLIMAGAMANAGIKGSMAGTGINTIFNRLAGENRNTHFAERLLGLEHAGEDGNMLMPLDFIKAFQKKIRGGMSVDDFLQVAEELSGEKIHADTRRKIDSTIESALKNGGKLGSSDMMKLGSMLAGLENAPKLMAMVFQDLEALEAKMTNVEGTAAGMANTMLENLAGSFTKLGSAWDAFQQSFLEGQAGDGLRNFVDSLTELLTRANKLFADGIQLGDIGKLIGDIIGRLKNKFLELDGIGSVLAGGALATGLLKIISLSRRAFDGLRNLGKAGAAGATTGGLSAAQKVGTMHVSAGVVNVNGKVGGVGGGRGGRGGRGGSRKIGDQAIIADYKAVKEYIRGPNAGAPKVVPPTAVPSRFAGFGSAAAGGAAFAGIFGLLDIMSLKASNAERLAMASTEAERIQITRENRQAEWEAGAGVTGSVIGAAIGAGLGSFVGPIGTAIGGIVGGMLGEYFGAKAGAAGAENGPTVNRTADVSQSKVQDILEGKLPGESKGFDDFADITNPHKAANWLLNPQRGQNYFGIKGEDLTHHPDMPANWKSMPELRRGAGHQGWSFERWLENKKAEDAKELAELQTESMNRQKEHWRKMSGQFQDNATAMDLFGKGMKDYSDNLFSHAEAGTPTAEQLATEGQVSMPEIIPPETSWLDEWFNFDGVSERLSELGSMVTDGLGSIMEGAGEVFSGLGESISAGMEAASSAATGALEGISSTFTAAKETIQAAWGELPGFFEGVFSGLGGAAAAAGSAIYNGLTAVIGSIIGAWESASATIGGIISSIGSMAASAGAGVSGAVSSVIARVTGHAEGGFVTSPELSWVGERGAELILPLTDRERSLELLNQASGMLGLDTGLDASSFVSQSSGDSSGEGVSVGDVTVNATFEINGADNPQDVMQTIQENLESLADKVAAKFAVNINDSYRNQALMT